jgi:hypothetical protein
MVPGCGFIGPIHLHMLAGTRMTIVTWTSDLRGNRNMAGVEGNTGGTRTSSPGGHRQRELAATCRHPQGGRGGQLRGRDPRGRPSPMLAVCRTKIAGTQTLLETARTWVPRFVHVSTDEVYGTLGPRAHSASRPLAPTAPIRAPKAPRTCWCGPVTRPRLRHGPPAAPTTTALPVPRSSSADDRPGRARRALRSTATAKTWRLDQSWTTAGVELAC